MNDGRDLTLGLRFRVDSATTITAVRWFKAVSEASAAHTAHIYDDATGARVASVTYTEPCSGPQVRLREGRGGV